MAVDLSIHTMILHHQIGFNEMNMICQKYNIPTSLDINVSYEKIMIAGVDNISIKTNRFPKGNRFNCKYEMSVRINAGRLIGDSQHLMLQWSKKNAEKVKARLQEVLNNDFFIRGQNGDLDEWYVKRIDCGMDIRVPEDACLPVGEYIDYLHEVYRSTRNPKYVYHIFNGYDTDEKRHESIYLDCTNGTHRYNIYVKQRELENATVLNSRLLTESELNEVDRVIRIEKQVEDFRVIHAGKKQFKYLLDENVTEKSMEKIQKELTEIFADDKDALFFREAFNMGNAGTHSYSFAELINENLSKRTKARHKSKFGKVYLAKEKRRVARYKANITIHHSDGTTFRTAVVGGVSETKEECERKVFIKINTNATNNLSSVGTLEGKIEVLQYKKDELEAFLTVISIENKPLKDDVANAIIRVQSEIDLSIKALEIPRKMHEMYGFKL